MTCYTLGMSDVRDLAVTDPEVLLHRIRLAFPDVQWRMFRFLDHGWDHQVIILDERIVFRFPNSTEYLNLFRNEREFLELMAKRCPIPMPRYTYMAPDGSFAGYEMVPGLELRAELFSALSAPERERLAGQLADFLTALHTTPLAEVEPLKVEWEDPAEYQEWLVKGAKQHLEGLLSERDYAKVQEILAEFATLVPQDLPKTLVHQDVSDEHLLWDAEAGRLGVIDFSDRALADPAVDFAELYLYGADFVGEVYARYRGPKDGDFLRRARVYERRVGVDLLIDSCEDNKISFVEAKAVFDRVTTPPSGPRKK
ncbi:MAG: hypothetical protein JWN01_761 [Patescibacteria group bacterium]|nr:hypothetical protein [Patescibacteria group bacterium]